ncbi:MAG: Zn-dependent protease, partial [Candidatus Rokuibacteriota bacterium]
MTNERFAALVQRLEREAAAHPAAYRLRVRLLAYLGYLYIGTVLAAVGAGLLFLGYLFTLHLTGATWIIAKVGWVLLLFAVIIVRALFVRFPPPDGIALERRQAPALFVLVDNIAQRLCARRPDQIVITDDFNASLAQRPRLGL